MCGRRIGLVLVAALLACLPLPSEQYCPKEGYARGESIEVYQNTLSAYACLVYCKGNSDCRTYSWTSDGICILHDAVHSGFEQPCDDPEVSCFHGDTNCLACGFEGKCEDGNKILEMQVKDETACLALCHNIDNCGHYSFEAKEDGSLGVCRLVESCPRIVHDGSMTLTTSGEKGCFKYCFEPGECQGKYLRHLIVDSKEECLLECQNNERSCNWFTFYVESRACLLFETCDYNADGCQDCFVGQKSCQL